MSYLFVRPSQLSTLLSQLTRACPDSACGRHVLPGTTPSAGQTPLPDDLEQAAVEQVAYWFRNRDTTALVRSWPHGGTYQAFAPLDLLFGVRAVLKKHVRPSTESS